MATQGSDPATWTTRAHRAPLMTLVDKVAPEHTALIVIDVQNDFCAPEGMMGKAGVDLGMVRELAGRLPAFLSTARSRGLPVVFVRSVYNSEDNPYLSDAWLEMASRRPGPGPYVVDPVCAPGSWGGEFYGGIEPEAGETIVRKHRYNAFHGTDLDVVLRARGVRTIVVAGVSTNICVESTARDGFMRDYYVVFPHDGTATYDKADHEATLRNIDRCFGQVVSLADIEDAWT